jgi:hypothetical protein
MKCAVIQPSFIPWRGYFHQIQKADCFVFYDDVQYDKHGWRNRNRIKTAQGTQWLTIPVLSHGAVNDHLPICEVPIDWKSNWPRKHLAAVKQSYGRTPFFSDYFPLLENAYEARPELLSDLTIPLTLQIANALGIENVRFERSSSLALTGEKTDRLVGLFGKLNVKHYISGPSAQGYLQEEKLRDLGVQLEYMVYDYPPYDQVHIPYDPQVTILDLLFMKGPEAGKFIWG